jgi:hypothetical protein
MRKIFMLAAILLSISAFGIPVNPITISSSALDLSSEPSPKEIKSLKIKDVQELLGRKLTLKEKITFFILKKKLNKQVDEPKQGQTAFALGIISIALLIAGLFLPYVILGALVAAIIAIVMGNMAKKKDPSDMKAKMGALMGWITLGGIALILILVAAIIASWSWGW